MDVEFLIAHGFQRACRDLCHEREDVGAAELGEALLMIGGGVRLKRDTRVETNALRRQDQARIQVGLVQRVVVT